MPSMPVGRSALSMGRPPNGAPGRTAESTKPGLGTALRMHFGPAQALSGEKVLSPFLFQALTHLIRNDEARAVVAREQAVGFLVMEEGLGAGVDFQARADAQA